ncbi:MAG TPA: LysR family transcriptional regulator [Rhodoferax sp.]
MLDWENLRHLAALAKGGSLSAAARLLDVEHATVARRITALETALGVRVVDRRGRKLLLTAEGDRLATIAERMEREAMAAERLAVSASRGQSH